MLTFLEANRVAIRIGPDELASLMIDLQRRSEAGEDASRLISGLAAELERRRVKRR